MKTREEIYKFIWNIMDVLRGPLMFRDLEYSVVRLVFLKYVVDNCTGALTKNDMQACLRAQKMFSMRNVDDGLDSIIPVLQMIDKSYDLENVLSSTDSIETYANILFGYENRNQKKNASSDMYRYVMDLLSSVDFEEESDSFDLGRVIVDCLVELIVNNSYRSMFATEYTSKPQLSKLASELLQVDSNDVFCDFAAGVGLSTIEIVKNTKTPIIIADLWPGAAAISAMLLIMTGHTNFKAICCDTLTEVNENIHGNKIFVDPPFGAKLKKTPENEYSDSSLAVINRVMNNYLDSNSNATALITLPAGILFRANKQSIDVKASLVDSGKLKAIISLPPMKSGTSVGVQLMVISNTPSEKIRFINATMYQQTSQKKNDINGDIALPDELIAKIVNSINSSESEEEFAISVDAETIKTNEYNLMPATYIPVKREEDTTTIEEVNDQLADLYKQLFG